MGRIRVVNWNSPLRRQRLSKFDHNALADAFIQEHHFTHNVRSLHFYRGDFWTYEKDHYEVIDKNYLESKIHYYLKAQWGAVSNGQWSAVCRAVKMQTTLNPAIELPNWIPYPPKDVSDFEHISMKNGIVHIGSLLGGIENVKFKPHTATWFSPHCLPFAFDPTAKCEKWIAYLNEIFEEDAERIALLQEWFGYSLIPDNSHQKAMIFYGKPRAGKGTVGAVLANLVGPENTSNVRVEDFGKRFQYMPLIGKLVNFCKEARKMNVDAVKSYVGGDVITTDRKGRDHVTFKPTARLVIESNEQLPFDDMSGAMDARLLILPFEKSFVGREIRNMDQTFIPELSGIFNWSIEGIRRLRMKGDFTLPAKSRQEAIELEEMNNPAKVWMLKTFEKCPLSETISPLRGDEAYEMYCDFWDRAGFPRSERWSRPKFSRELRRVFDLPESAILREGNGLFRGWKMLRKLA